MAGKLINQLKRLADAPAQSLASTDLVPVQLANAETRAVTVAQLAASAGGSGADLGYVSGVYAAAPLNIVTGSVLSNTAGAFTTSDIALTFNLAAAARVKLELGLCVNSTAAAYGRFDPGFVVDGVQSDGFKSETILPIGAGGKVAYVERTYRVQLAAGTHTIRPCCYFTDVPAGQLTTPPNYPIWLAATRET